ncbi:MAG: hypothetical protein JXB15_12115 [Anaerolineales bacterium]|nr:hypothetical protein [Anaerolineales bacterium]
MIQHVWSVLCQGSSIDSDSNRISLFNILESIQVIADQGKIINLPIPFEIISLWVQDASHSPAQGETRVSYIQPSGDTKSISTTKLDLSEAAFFRHRVIGRGLQLSGPGRYTFLVEFQNEGEEIWHSAASIPFFVYYLPPEKPTDPEATS